MQDFPELGRIPGWTTEPAERGNFLKLAEKHLRRFEKWKKQQPWDGRTATLYTAQLYCVVHGLPPRFAFIQTLTQLYEQKALSLIRDYPPMLRKRKFSFMPFNQRERAPPTLS